MDNNNPRPASTPYLFLALGIALLVIAMTPIGAIGGSNAEGGVVSLDAVVAKAKAGEISRAVVGATGDQVTVYYRDGSAERAALAPGAGNFADYLARMGVGEASMPAVQAQQQPNNGGIMGFLGPLLPILIFGGVITALLLLFSRRRPSNPAGDQTGQAMQFARSKARVIVADRPSTTFDDVAGADEAKEELAEVVDFLKHPEKYAALGARIPKGLLMAGPPGTGKTLLARAVAGEAGVPFLSISGSEFVEMFVGVGAARVRDLFEQARKNAPCIVFVDEIDAVGRHRGAGIGGGNDEREQTLNQILVEMDGFDARTNIIVVAATNRPDVLDPALLRPGRFDRQILLDRPDSKGRLAILQVHARGKPLDPEVDLEQLAKMTPGFSGADLENLLNEAALLAARRDGTAIGYLDLQEAVDRVLAGPRRKSRIISPREKSITAYHEAGHAIVAHVLPNVDPVQKITIVSRGMAGGYTRILPTEDRHLFTRSEFKETLAWALGGHVAEQMTFGEMSTGASNDIERATQLARQMVMQYGMSDQLGPVAFVQQSGAVFLGRGGEATNFSNEIAYQIDKEVRALMDEALESARQIIVERRETLVAMAEALIEQETLEGDDLLRLLGRKVMPQWRVPSLKLEPKPARGKGERPAELPESQSRTGERPAEGAGPLTEAALRQTERGPRTE